MDQTSPSDVQTPTPNQDVKTSPTSGSAPKKSKRTIIVAAVLLVLALTASSLVAYIVGSRANTIAPKEEAKTQATITTPPPSQIPTATKSASNDAVYSNSEIGVEFTYPKTFSGVSSESEGCYTGDAIKPTEKGLHMFSLSMNAKKTQFMSLFRPYDEGCGAIPRGGGRADAARSIESQEYIENYCENNKDSESISNCTTFTNPHGVRIAKSLEESYPGDISLMYRMKAKKAGIQGIVLYDAVLKDSHANAEDILDSIANSIKLTN